MFLLFCDLCFFFFFHFVGNLSPREVVLDDTQAPSFPKTNNPSPLLPKFKDSQSVDRHNGKTITSQLKREPVVVLTRLPPRMITLSCRRKSQNYVSEDESANDSDVQWVADGASSYSDDSISNERTGSNKRRKVKQEKEKPSTTQTSTNTNTNSDEVKTSTPPGNTSGNDTIYQKNTIQEHEFPNH